MNSEYKKNCLEEKRIEKKRDAHWVSDENDYKFYNDYLLIILAKEKAIEN